MANQDLTIPIITIDGVAGTGKGAVRSIVARELGFHQLDSGALYRSVALISIEKNITKVSELVSVADNLIFQMKNNKALLRGRDVTTLIRSNQVADRASEISKIKEVRQALLKHELSAQGWWPMAGTWVKSSVLLISFFLWPLRKSEPVGEFCNSKNLVILPIIKIF